MVYDVMSFLNKIFGAINNVVYNFAVPIAQRFIPGTPNSIWDSGHYRILIVLLISYSAYRVIIRSIE